MSTEGQEIYADGSSSNVESSQNQQQQQQTESSTTPPTSTAQPFTAKRKRETGEESNPADNSVQGRRASLKRTSQQTANTVFMPVNQASGPPTAPMAFTNATNGGPQDLTAAINNLDPQMAHAIQFNQDSTVNAQQYGAMSQLPPGHVQMVQPSATGGTPGQPLGQPLVQPQQTSPPAPPAKPQVGTEEWHKVRRDNHKEVERRRRETINEGINELAKIVPNCEKNKGSILQRAVQFIQQLKENEANNIEKWSFEKLLTEQAIAELTSTNERLVADIEKLKAECERAWREADTWKKSCQALQSGTGAEEPNDNTNSTASASASS